MAASGETKNLEITRCDNGTIMNEGRMLPNIPNGNTNSFAAIDPNPEQQQEMQAGGEYSSLLPPLSSNQTADLSNGLEKESGTELEAVMRGGEDSVDGSPSPTARSAANLSDVMLESVDLRSVSLTESHNFSGLSHDDMNKPDNGGGLWHGSVETSTDTLVPMNALTEEEKKHFPGIENGDLANFLTKRQENDDRLLMEGSSSNGIQNGIDCSVYGERSFNMALLNNQSIYNPTTTTAPAAKMEHNLNIMDMSLMDSVIQSQPLSTSAKRRQMDTHRHRRTPSNSKSEPSPHKFQNGK